MEIDDADAPPILAALEGHGTDGSAAIEHDVAELASRDRATEAPGIERGVANRSDEALVLDRLQRLVPDLGHARIGLALEQLERQLRTRRPENPSERAEHARRHAAGGSSETLGTKRARCSGAPSR